LKANSVVTCNQLQFSRNVIVTNLQRRKLGYKGALHGQVMLKKGKLNK